MEFLLKATCVQAQQPGHLLQTPVTKIQRMTLPYLCLQALKWVRVTVNTES